MVSLATGIDLDLVLWGARSQGPWNLFLGLCLLQNSFGLFDFWVVCGFGFEIETEIHL